MDVYNDVKRILAEHLHINEEKVMPNSNLIDDLGADSLDSIEIIMNLEEKFGIEISNKEVLHKPVTLQDLEKKIKGE